MVLDSPGRCCEAICEFVCLNIDGFAFSRRLLWSHLRFFLFKYYWFWILQEVVVKQFAHFFVEIFMVLDSPGGCCEAICKNKCWNIDGFGFSRRLLWSHVHIFFVEILLVLDSPGGCCEAICTFFLLKYWLFWILKEAVVKPFSN